MKKIFIIFLMLLLNSCFTLRPDSSGVTTKDYNNKQEISYPKFVKKRNAIGVSFNIVSPFLAGAAMYQYAPPIVKYQDGAETKGFQPANAVVGVIGMLCVNKIFNYAFGYNKRELVNDISVNKWMKKTNLSRSYNFIAEDRASKLIIIPKSNENNYIVKSITDVLYFKNLYPNASNENIATVIQKAIPVLENEDIVKLISYYQENQACYQAKIKYITTAKNYSDLWNRAKTFPDAKIDMETLALDLIASGDNLMDFIPKFPSSNNMTKAKVYSYKNPYNSTNIGNNILIKNNIFEIKQADFLRLYNNSNPILENYFNAKFDYKKVNSINNLAYFFTENLWLTKLINSKVKLEKAWNIGYDEYPNGDNLVYLLKTFHKNGWNISEYEIDTFVDEKLIIEISKYVKVINSTLKAPENKDMDRWRSSGYASLTIKGSGEALYLLYGDIQNGSKFSLPIKITSTSSLKLMHEGGATFIEKAAIALATGNLVNETWSRKGDVSAAYLMGYLRPNEKGLFAAMYVLDGSLESGVDLGIRGMIGSMQYAERIRLDNHRFDIKLSNEPISPDIINKQNSWLKFIKDDLPEAQMMDALRGIPSSISQDILDVEAEGIRQQMRKAEELRKTQESANEQNTLVLQSNNAKYEVNVNLDPNKSNVINIFTRNNDNYNCCYMAAIYKYDSQSKNIGRELKKYTNEDRGWFSSANQSIDDNNIYLQQTDFPVIVVINYRHNNESVSLSVLLNKGSKIEVIPNN